MSNNNSGASSSIPVNVSQKQGTMVMNFGNVKAKTFVGNIGKQINYCGNSFHPNIPKQAENSQPRLVYNDVFMNKETSQILTVFYTQDSQTNINTMLGAKGYTSILPGLPSCIKCHSGDMFKIKMNCKVPEGSIVETVNNDTVIIDEAFQSYCSLEFRLVPELPEDFDEKTEMEYAAWIQDRDMEPKKMLLTKKWAKKNDGVGKTTNITGQNVFYKGKDIHMEARGTTTSIQQ